jgi:hypothetical protein
MSYLKFCNRYISVCRLFELFHRAQAWIVVLIIEKWGKSMCWDPSSEFGSCWFIIFLLSCRATFSRITLFFFYFLLFGLWGHWHCGHSWPIVPASGDSEDDCGEADGMYIGRGNRSSRRKPAPAPLLSITKSHMIKPRFEPGTPWWEASG